MRATSFLETATYVTLGCMVALIVTLSQLALSVLVEGETQVAQMCVAQTAVALTANRGATLAGRSSAGPQRAARHSTPADIGINPSKVPERMFFGSASLLPERLATGNWGDGLSVWTIAPRLFRELLQKRPLNSAVDDAAGDFSFRRLRQGAVLIEVAAVVSGLLLFVLIRRSFMAQKAEKREAIRAKEDLELSAKERTAALQRALATLRLHSAHVDAAREEERVRIARDIHDDLGSTLTALKLELSGVLGCPDERARKLPMRRASTDLVDSAMQSVRCLIAALHPYPLERAGLWGALVWKAGEFEKLTGIPCRVVMNDELPRPSDEISIAAFRIVEEALTNVARHAHARAVELVVRVAADQLDIEVTDDGSGIPNGGARFGAVSYGLTGMQERARAVGGTLKLASRADRGTTVHFSVQSKAASEMRPVLQEETS